MSLIMVGGGLAAGEAEAHAAESRTTASVARARHRVDRVNRNLLRGIASLGFAPAIVKRPSPRGRFRPAVAGG